MTDRTIVGIDPGTTAAVAVLSLDGDLEAHMSGKHLGKNDLIQYIIDHGNPLIVASDVSPAPALVEEIASNLGAVLYVPEEDLQADYKHDLVGSFNVAGADAHTLDALAAAEYSRREHAEKIGRVQRRVREAGQRDDLDAVIDLVFRDEYSISDALQQVEDAAEEGEAASSTQRQERDWERIAGKRMRTIERLRDKVAHLEEYLEELESEEVEESHNGVPEEELIERNRVIADLRDEVDRQEAMVERLRDENERLWDAVDHLRSGWRFVPTVDDTSTAAESIVDVDTFSGGQVNDAVDVVIADTVTGTARGVTVIERDDIPHVNLPSEGIVVDPNALEEGTEEFMAWLEEYRER